MKLKLSPSQHQKISQSILESDWEDLQQLIGDPQEEQISWPDYNELEAEEKESLLTEIAYELEHQPTIDTALSFAFQRVLTNTFSLGSKKVVSSRSTPKLLALLNKRRTTSKKKALTK